MSDAYCVQIRELGGPDVLEKTQMEPRHPGPGEVLVRQSARLNGLHGVALTKLDVLDGFDELKVCTGYKLDGEILDRMPASTRDQARIEPVYETMEGWGESTFGARSWADLPAAAVKYVRRVEELIGCPVAMLSTSPEREDVILMADPFKA